jgi:hypothetical protein
MGGQRNNAMVVACRRWKDILARQRGSRSYGGGISRRVRKLRVRRLPTGELESGFEKIALFASDGVPKHAARQLESGRWTSKLGTREDIEHALHDLEGAIYGSVALVMKRPLPRQRDSLTA